ncbi:hypothetical protein GCM10007967_00580 [Xylanimonas ulmi]|uniref:Uncharacterized protein n=1 Tax=Xylanimonas ulmi TaxID=228973 RepID=A0A4Q7M626_9MICO|nr:hypothetical protein EV386_3287 [Xylanibacterium ulmi]
MGALAAALFAGCGGPTDAPDPTPAPEPSAVVVAPDAVVPESDGGAQEPDEQEDTGDGVDCPALQATWNQANQALVNLSADHPRALVNSFRVAADAMSGVEVPDAIADSWATMSRYLDRVNAALEDVDASDADAVSAAMSRTVSAEDTQEATAAGERITDFFKSGCAG